MAGKEVKKAPAKGGAAPAAGGKKGKGPMLPYENHREKVVKKNNDRTKRVAPL